MQLIEAVPNFSLGPAHPALPRLSEVLQADPYVALLHQDSSVDSGRTVFTLVGPPDLVVKRLIEAALLSYQQVDLSVHQGNHPYIGVLDVCPLIGLIEVSLVKLVALSHQLGRQIAEEAQVPVFFYQHSGHSQKQKELSFFRQGGIKGLASRLEAGTVSPDQGPRQLHPSRGACVVGARRLMLAFNLNMPGSSLKAAQALARRMRSLRATNPALSTVRFLGWFLENQEIAQLSTNLMDLEQMSMSRLVQQVQTEANKLGFQVKGSELVGMCPLSALVQSPKDDPRAAAQRVVGELGLNSLQPFQLQKKVLEFALEAQGFVAYANALSADSSS